MTHTSDSYRKLYEFSQALHAHHHDLNATFQTILQHTAQSVNASQGCLVTFNDQTQIEHVYVWGTPSTEGLTPEVWEMLMKRGVVGHVYHGDRVVVIRNLRTDPRWMSVPDLAALPQQGSAISLPLNKGRFVFGVLLLLHPEIDYFSRGRMDLLSEFAQTASLAASNALDLQAARHNDTRYISLFEEAIVPILLTDLHGFIMDVNHEACRFLGFQKGDLLRVPVEDVHIKAVEQQRIAELMGNDASHFPTTMYDVDGHAVPVRVRVRLVKRDGRSLIEWVIQDMSTQVELDQLRNDLSAMIYHDLRGPLTAILGSIYKLGQVLQNHENPAVLKLLHIGLRSTRQLQQMVESLLDIQRMEEGKSILNRQTVEAQVLVGDAVQLVQPLAQDAEQVLTFDVNRDFPLLHIDSDMMIRVLINLMENAVKYTPTGGSIHLKATYDETHATFTISDSGPGIPPDKKASIFEKFSRVNYQDAPKGVGLGLAFCRLAVEAHGGNIWVESELGKGSDFIVRLPITSIPALPPQADKRKTTTRLATTA